MAKIVPKEVQDGRRGGYLENLFLTSSPEPKGQLTRNMVGSIGVTWLLLVIMTLPGIFSYPFVDQIKLKSVQKEVQDVHRSGHL